METPGISETLLRKEMDCGQHVLWCVARHWARLSQTQAASQHPRGLCAYLAGARMNQLAIGSGPHYLGSPCGLRKGPCMG